MVRIGCRKLGERIWVRGFWGGEDLGEDLVRGWGRAKGKGQRTPAKELRVRVVGVRVRAKVLVMGTY